MKINKKTSKKKNILISAVIIALAFLALVIFFIKKDYFLNIFEETSVNDSTINEVVIDNNPPTQEQIDAGQIQKEESNEQPNNDLGTITYIDISSNEVVINSVISGIVTSNGVCYLALSSGENLVTKESSTYALPSSSTCMGFTINKSELRTGTWQVELSVLANDKTSKVYDEFILE